MFKNRERQAGKKGNKGLLFIGLPLAFVAGIGSTMLPITIRDGGVPATSNTALAEDLDYSSVEEIYDTLRKNYDGELDQATLLDGIKKGLAAAVGDEYTEYYNASAAQELTGELNGTFVGIGAELGKDNDNLIVVAPLEGYPAQRAGLRARDMIAEINGESTAGMTVEAAVGKIRGEKDTEVKLTIVRDSTEKISFTIMREQIQIDSVKSEVLENNIGYIRITRFDLEAPTLTRKAAVELKAKGVDRILLDLRSNPGGYLDSSVDIAELWAPNKTIVTEKHGDVVLKTYKSGSEQVLEGVKTVVLVDEGSASASEILAGALKDYGAATLVGEKTFGKGVVQKLEDLQQTKDGVLKVTVAKWYTPNGNNIHKQGIVPDVESVLSEADITNKVDSQRTKAIEVLKGL
jgi:carboxyl-terminal processing protease